MVSQLTEIPGGKEVYPHINGVWGNANSASDKVPLTRCIILLISKLTRYAFSVTDANVTFVWISKYFSTAM